MYEEMEVNIHVFITSALTGYKYQLHASAALFPRKENLQLFS
jgi:hypothetical protein